MDDKVATIRTSVKFEAAHRQYGDTSKCGLLHGHNWKVDIEIYGGIGPLGYIIDFKKIKDLIRDKFDHATILANDDPLIISIRNYAKLAIVPCNPTCENLAIYIRNTVNELLDIESHLHNEDYDPDYCSWYCTITVWENDESYARV